MRIAVCQEAFRAGNPEENYKKARAAYRKATEENADLLVYPSQMLMGSHPGDLMEYAAYAETCVKLQKKLVRETNAKTGLVFDTPFALDGSLSPALMLAFDGCVCSTISILDADDITDHMVDFGGRRIFIAPFRDDILMLLHHPDVVEKADAVVLMDCHQFVVDNEESRVELLDAMSKIFPVLVYANQAGGHETAALLGASAVYVKGELCMQLPYFKPATGVCDIDTPAPIQMSPSAFSGREPGGSRAIELIHDAIVQVIADYFKHCHTTQAVIGLSGGIDSSVVLPLAVEALGRKNVFGIMMPSQFSTDHSVNDAVKLAENLQIYYEIIPIAPLYKAFMKQLKPVFDGTPFGLAEENLQARIRGNLLMAAANKRGAIVLNTSNKSESACGYGTLYGDLCGGLSVLGDLYKSQVYDLARYINRKKEIIPLHCITKAPSAELHPGQKDSDSLPPYDTIEKIIRLHLERRMDERQIVAQGVDKATVQRVLGLFYRNEYKRRQVPPVIQISSTTLGTDIEIPM